MEWLREEYHRLFPSTAVTCLVLILIICACLTGDHLLSLASQSDFSEYGSIARAMIDNSTHALVGALVWALVENAALLSEWKKWSSCILCAFLAAAVDLDHFIAAGALDMKKALSLPKRPPFHNTSLLLIVVILLWALQRIKPTFKILSLMFLSSGLSHHLRDANHRGLWLSPFGHTPIFPSYMYIALIILLGLGVRILYYHKVLSTKLLVNVDSGIV